MNGTRIVALLVVCMLMLSSRLYSQTEKEQIRAARNASNTALKTYDNDTVLSYLTEDVLTTTGNGTLLCGKEALARYIKEGGKSKMYWIRDAREIIVNTERRLAWERGIWNGYDPEKSDEPIVNGNYSAMWTKKSGVWKIKSQLFVTINEN